jgi:hypothetical protein
VIETFLEFNEQSPVDRQDHVRASCEEAHQFG